MWRLLTDSEREKIIVKLKKESTPFALMFFMFGVLTIFSLMLLTVSITTGLMCMIAFGSFALMLGSKVKKYDRDLNFFIDDVRSINICKTEVLKKRALNSNKSGVIYYGVTVRLFVCNEMKEIELVTGYDLKENEEVYVVSDLERYHKIFKLTDIESNDLN